MGIGRYNGPERVFIRSKMCFEFQNKWDFCLSPYTGHHVFRCWRGETTLFGGVIPGHISHPKSIITVDQQSLAIMPKDGSEGNIGRN